MFSKESNAIKRNKNFWRLNARACAQKLKKQAGYALIWVLVVLLAGAALTTVAATSVSVSMRSTQTQYSSQQAYYTARSAASVTAQYIIAHNADDTAIRQFILNPGTGSAEGMGNYTVQVSYDGVDRVKIMATATYQGQTRTAAVYLVRPPVPTGVNPLASAIFVNGPSVSGFGQCSVTGDTYIKGNFIFSYGSVINGNLVVQGTASVMGGSIVNQNLVSTGTVLLDGGAIVKGNAYTQGDITLTGGASLKGNLTADGSVYANSGSGWVEGNAVIGGNGSFGGGANRIWGRLTYAGNLSFAYGDVSTFISGGAVKASYTKLDLTAYASPSLPIIPLPDADTAPGLYDTLPFNGRTINRNGTITQSYLNSLSTLSWGSTITIDASAQDIYLRVNDLNFNTTNGYKFVVSGSNKVYVFLTGSSTFSVNANQFIGNLVQGSNPKLFIIGDGAQTVTITGNSELNACVYMPNGTLIASGSSLDDYKFVGSCIVKTVNINSNVAFLYSPPQYEDTLLDVFEGAGGSPSGTSWIIESWDNT